MLLWVFFGVFAAVVFIFLKPFVTSLGNSLVTSRSMLLVFPDDVITHVPVIMREILRITS